MIHPKDAVRFCIMLSFFVVGLFSAVYLFAEPPAAKRADGVFADLIGQPVGINNDLHGHTILNTLDDKTVPLGHKVVEVGRDYIVLEDTTGNVRTTIPVYAIKQIVRTKLPTKVATSLDDLKGKKVVLQSWSPWGDSEVDKLLKEAANE